MQLNITNIGTAGKYIATDVATLIPEELKSINQWINWRAGPKGVDGKFKKYPLGKDGTGTAWQKPHQWSSFNKALRSCANLGVSGVGIVLPATLPDGSYLVALDYDTVDLYSKDNNPRLNEIEIAHESLGSPYSEASPSGMGIRMFVKSAQSVPQLTAVNPIGGKDELFCASPKWVTVTGWHLGGGGIPEATQGIGDLVTEWGDADLCVPKKSHSSPARVELPGSGSPFYAKLTPESLAKTLARIDCSHEPNWFDVANALARAYGSDGRLAFEEFSRGEYENKPYVDFDYDEVHQKFDRALTELEDRPDGFGVKHLLELAGLSEAEVEFEEHQLGMAIQVTPAQQAAGGKINFPVLGNNKKPLQISANLAAVLSANGIEVRYNQITKRAEYLVPHLKCVFDERDNTALSKLTDCALISGMVAQRVPELAASLAAQNPYCPVQAYIDSKPWDGKMRFTQFTNQLRCGNPTLAQLLWKRWLIQAVAAVYEPRGISNAGMIVLTGAQGLGKTKLFKDLTAGVSDVFLEGHILNPSDKDSVLTATRHWVVELGELDATFRKADIAQLKAFITKNTDTVRKPYAAQDSTMPRRTVFAGTVNDYQFLHDQSGNRRFWPIDVNELVRDPSIDYQQLWAQAKYWYDAGERHYLSSDEMSMLNQFSETFVVSDPEVEKLLVHYPFANCGYWIKERMSKICDAIGIEHPTKAQQMRIAAAIIKHNGGQKPLNSNGVRLHFVPDIKAINNSKTVAPVAP